MVICFFAREIYRPQLVSKGLSAIGKEWTVDALEELGRKIYVEKQILKMRDGFDPRHMRVPQRIFEIDSLRGRINREYVAKALKYYQESLQKIQKRRRL